MSLSKSALEAELGGHLTIMARREIDPWPEPVPQHHPLWCCDHRLAEHFPSELRKGEWDCRLCGDSHVVWRERNWSVDFAYPALKIAIECDGVAWQTGGGRHTRPAGYERDRERDLTLEARGWRVIRATQRDITSGLVLSAIEAAINERRVAEGTGAGSGVIA